MKSYLFLLIFKNILKDNFVRFSLIFTISIFLLISFLSNLFLSCLILLSLLWGCAVAIILLSHKEEVEKITFKVRALYYRSSANTNNTIKKEISNCDICMIKQCKRHNHTELNKTKWSKILIDSSLDEAVESFYSKIISSFVQSWFVLLSHDNDFVQTLKQSLREATSHLIEKISLIDGPQFITEKLCPILFKHVDTLENMLNDGILMDKLPNIYIFKDNAIHPAVGSRQAEKDYLRAVAKCLIPKIFHSETFDSKIFFSLVRELIACWVLLPLMDVLSDPNLLNLMIINLLNKNQNEKFNKINEQKEKVEFLKNFVEKNNSTSIVKDSSILTDNNKLYSFMQYLKKGDAVDVLRFYLDVDNLNKELQDSKTITDPAKLSTLYQESEKLLQDYEILIKLDKIKEEDNVISLTDAYENVKNLLETKWRKAFSKTTDYFKLIYGSRLIEIVDVNKNLDQNWGVSKIRSKIKGAFRGNIDGGTYEIPTVWDALAEPSIAASNLTIYSSVTQKLRRERGQNLDNFLLTFISSLEQNTDVGEDVISMTETKKQKFKPYSTESSFVFGNLFGLNRNSNKFLVSSYISFYTIGPSRSFLYIAKKLFQAPSKFVKFFYSLIYWSQKMIDIMICQIINKLISMGLHQPRLAVLIKLLENNLFEEKNLLVSPAELLERQKRARISMEEIFKGSGSLIDILQSPPLNKHLMYCAFDAIISEIYPELRS